MNSVFQTLYTKYKDNPIEGNLLIVLYQQKQPN